jgi:hypothetical protein
MEIRVGKETSFYLSDDSRLKLFSAQTKAAASSNKAGNSMQCKIKMRRQPTVAIVMPFNSIPRNAACSTLHNVFDALGRTIQCGNNVLSSCASRLMLCAKAQELQPRLPSLEPTRNVSARYCDRVWYLCLTSPVTGNDVVGLRTRGRKRGR